MEVRNNKVKIIQIMGMPGDATWQGRTLGLGDDGVVYMDEHSNGSGWVTYIKDEYKGSK